MPEEQDAAIKTVDLEAEVWNAISAFEQIVETMPEDRTSLEALAGAYEQIGDLARAKDFLLRLAGVLVKARDAEAAWGLIERLEAFATDDSDARAPELLEAIRSMQPSGKPSGPVRAREEIIRQRVRAGFNMAEGISFAWSLMEGGDLSESEYAAVVQDLTEMSVKGGGMVTVSVLHVLEARGFKGLERMLTRCAKEWGTPVLRLGGFEFLYPIVALLPYDFVVRCGALVFETLGDHLLVAVMSPYDKDLCKDIEAILGKPCHFYATLPAEFDQAAMRLATLIEEHKQQAKNEAEVHPA